MRIRPRQIVTHKLYEGDPIDAPKGYVVWRRVTAFDDHQSEVVIGVRFKTGGSVGDVENFSEAELIPHPSEDTHP